MAKCKIYDIDDVQKQVHFYCPGCKDDHAIHVGGPEDWTWNADVDNPTVSPSILAYPNHRHGRCHSFIKGGKWQFLSDCDHELKGQTVDVPEWPEGK